jgi:hypothetical protein
MLHSHIQNVQCVQQFIPISAKRVRNLAVSVYDLVPAHHEQLEIFATKFHAVAEAMDKINDKYSEFVITPLQ